MIESISEWAKNITLAVVVVSIFEMLIPNKKMKQYINVVMGLYILFNILSPLIGKNFSIDIGQIINNSTEQVGAEPFEENSMNKRLKEIGEEELEKDITEKIEKLGFVVSKCTVKIEIEDEMSIKNITLNIEKNSETKKEDIENILVKEIQKIKKIEVDENQENDITQSDINEIKQFLMEEYEVSEACLKIN